MGVFLNPEPNLSVNYRRYMGVSPANMLHTVHSNESLTGGLTLCSAIIYIYIYTYILLHTYIILYYYIITYIYIYLYVGVS